MTANFRRTLRRKRHRAARAIQTLGAIAVLMALVAYFGFGTLSPCGMLRETARHLDGLAAVFPDSILDLFIEAKYGVLSPGRYLAIMLNDQSIPHVELRSSKSNGLSRNSR